ncbi:hypothetical protein [Lysinibacillus sp. 54212]|uniref:hypothetical protein n=1 Tax=Lysinibacillus sp. 54212 TaxID=3119829 RepID=UPI002FCC5F9F
MSKRIWVRLAGLLLMSLVIINAYLLFNEDSKITKKYYISSFQEAVKGTNVEKLNKEGILATNNEVRVSADVKSLTEVSVKRGQLISANEELGVYKQDDAQKEILRLEVEKEAYETELDTLEDLLDDIEDDVKSSKPASTIDSEKINDLLSITLGLEVHEQTYPAEAIARLGEKIAEVEREIEIIDGLITQLETNDVLASPIDGVIGDITEQGDTITFVIYATEKSIVAYVTEDQWQRVQVEQDAVITIHAGEENEQTVEGIVIEKQAIPARQSLWFHELEKNEKVDDSKTIYEIRIQPYELLLDYPYGLVVDSTITTKEIVESYKVKSDWVISQEIPNIGKTHVYTLGYDGKTRLVPITVEFKKKDSLATRAKKKNKASDGNNADDEVAFDEDSSEASLSSEEEDALADDTEDAGFTGEDDFADEYNETDFSEDADFVAEFEDVELTGEEDSNGDTELVDETGSDDADEDIGSVDAEDEAQGEENASEAAQGDDAQTTQGASLINPLKKVKKKQLPQYDVTVFTAAFDEHTYILDNKLKNIYAPTFLPLPMKKFEWEKVGEITWQDILLFMRY